MLNKQTVCGILRPREWQKYLRLQKSYLLSCSRATIRLPFDSHTEKKTMFPCLPPTHRPASWLSLFSFLSFFLRLLLHKTSGGVGQRHLSCMDAVNYVSSVAGSSLWLCVWHSKWEILGNLAKLSANSLHFSFLPGSTSWEPPPPPPTLKKATFFFFFVQPVSEVLCFELANIEFGAKTKHNARIAMQQAPKPRFLSERGPNCSSFRRD